MRDATTAPEYELDHARPATAAPQDRRDSISAEAASLGNAAFSGVVGARHASRFRSSAPPLARHASTSVLARKDTGRLEGHDAAMTMATGYKTMVRPGQKGHTDKLAEELPEMAGEELAEAYAAGQQLSPVRPDYTSFDRSMKQSVASGEANIAEMMQEARVKEEFMCKKFSYNVPRANQVLMSMSRLKAAKKALGVPDFMTLQSEVVSGLEAAGPVVEQLKKSGKAAEQNTAPKGTSSLTGATAKVNSAKGKVNTTWLKMRALFERDLAGQAKAKGDVKRGRVEEINKNINQLKQAGATVDLAMTTMGVGLTGKTEDGGLRGATGGSAGGASISQEIDGEFTWGKSTIPAGATKVGKDAAAAVGLELPTSASAILGDIGKLYYMKELAQLQQAIAAFDRLESTHLKTAVKADTWALKEEFKNVVRDLKTAVDDYQAARAQRLTDYANFGKQLDETAAASAPTSAAGKAAPGKGKERFKLIMYVTGLAREVLTNADAAIEGFGGTPGASGKGSAAAQMADDITQLRFDVPGFESHMRVDSPNSRAALRQLSNFEEAVRTFHNVLDPIATAAGDLLGKATTEKGSTAY